MLQDLNYDRLLIDTNPVKLRVLSEVYLVYTSRRVYAPAIDVQNIKSKIKSSVWVSASSIATRLEEIREINQGGIVGIEFWLEKDSDDKFAKYILTEA